MQVTKIALLLLSALAITGCSRQPSKNKFSEVTFEEFRQKAIESYHDVPYTKGSANGTVVYKGMTYPVSGVKVDVKDGQSSIDVQALIAQYSTGQLSEEDLQKILLLSQIVNMNAVAACDYYEQYFDELDEESVKGTFYLGNGFKATFVNSENNITVRWDKYAMITEANGSGEIGNARITINYSKQCLYS